MKKAKFFVILAFLLCVGFAFAQVGVDVGTLSELKYEKPLQDVPKSGIVVSGGSGFVECDHLSKECSYVFKVENVSGSDISDLMVSTFFSSNPGVSQIMEAVPETYTEWESYCVKEGIVDDKNGDLGCVEWGYKKLDKVRYSTKSLPLVGKSSSLRTLDSKSYFQKENTEIVLNNGSVKYFKVVFKPSTKTGEVVFIAESSLTGFKGSLDPSWTNEVITTTGLNPVTVSNIDANTGFFIKNKTSARKLKSMTVTTNTTATWAYLMNGSYQLISKAAIVDGNAVFNDNPTLNADTNYYIIVNAAGNLYDRNVHANYFNLPAAYPSNPIVTTEVTFWTGIYGGSVDRDSGPIQIITFADLTLDANFTYTCINGCYIDASAGKTTAIVDFNETSGFAITDWNWYVNLAKVSDDQNYRHTFSAIGDYNVMLKVKSGGTDYNVTKVITISAPLSTLSINLDSNSIISSDSNIQYTLKASWTGGTPTSFWWTNWGVHFGGDTNYLNAVSNTPGDYNYCVIASIDDANKIACKTVYVTKIVLKIPKDESSLALISPYTFVQYSNVTTSNDNLYADTNIFLVDFGTSQLIIDSNVNSYSSRTYTVDENFDNTLVTLQPYLIDSNGSLDVVLIVYNGLTKTTIPNVSISVKKLIGGSFTEILSLTTDDSGQTLGTFSYNQTYYFDVTYGSFYQRFLKRILSSTSVKFFLDINNDLNYSLPGIASVNISYSYGGINLDKQQLPKTGNNYTWMEIITGTNLTIYDVNVLVTQNGGIKYWANDNITPFTPVPIIPDSNVIAMVPLEVTTTVRHTFGTSVFRKQIVLNPSTVDRLELLKNIKQDIGQAGTMFLALLIMLFIMAVFHQKITNDYDALGFVTALLIGMFSYIEWVPVEFFYFSIIIVVLMGARRFL